jgi:hypothetical protein
MTIYICDLNKRHKQSICPLFIRYERGKKKKNCLVLLFKSGLVGEKISAKEKNEKSTPPI